MFTKKERNFIKNTMEKATVQGVDNMRIILSIIEKCDEGPDTPAVREVTKHG